MKKFIVIAIVLTMIFSLGITALASTSAVSAKIIGNGNNRQVEVSVGSEKGVFAFVNGSKSGTYLVDGAEVAVEFSGNSVKSAKIVSYIPEFIAEGTVAALVETADPESDCDLRTFTMEQTWNKTTYHCGIDNGGTDSFRRHCYRYSTR